MSNPLVTVSLVAFNQAAFIREAIESCLIQKTQFDYEIIIHDDASGDNTAEIILEYAEKYPEIIRPIIQTENQFSKGTEINAKITIPQAKGKYIAFLEADDYWIDPEKLQYQVDFMESHPEVSMCFTATKTVDAANPKEFSIRRYKNTDSPVSAENVILIGGHLLDMGSAVAKKSVFDEVPDWYYFSQMWDNTVPLLSTLHGEIYYLNKVTSAYRVNTPGSYMQKNVKVLEKRKSHILKTLKLLEGYNQATENKYEKLIRRKTNLISVGALLLMEQDLPLFKKYYSQLTPLLKLEYKIFHFIGRYGLWKKYRQFLSMFRKIKYV